jgi:hypothetical protein
MPELYLANIDDELEDWGDLFLGSCSDSDSMFSMSLSKYQSWTGVGCGLVFPRFFECFGSLTVITTCRNELDVFIDVEDTKLIVKQADESPPSRSCN